MTDEERRFERDLDRLLAASRASANPAVWTRVRARLVARTATPVLLRWLGRPEVLAAACALFVACMTAGAVIERGVQATNAPDTELVSSLLGDDGTYGLPGSAPAITSSGGATDSGEVTQ